MYEIDKGIEIPAPNIANNARRLYPFPEMEIGDSFLVPGDGDKKVLQARLGSAACYFGKRNSKRFVTRSVEGGVRVWRVE